MAFFFASINSILVTNPSVTDTDPSTYIIVVMLMIFFFIIFSLKEDLKLNYKDKNLIYGVLVFIFYAMLLFYSRVSLSYLFQVFRVDALLFPLLLLSFILIIFGVEGAKRMRYVALFAIFASPVILLPLLEQNSIFANINATLVYGVLLLLGIPVAKAGLVITAPSSASITISTTCVSLGTFVALIMFLAPVAYLYYGSNKKRVFWIFSGFLLSVILNFIRMLTIAGVWAFEGLDSAVNVFHLFGGQLIFYLVIIFMVLLAGKFGMRIKKIPKNAFADLELPGLKDSKLLRPIVIVIVLGILIFLFSLQYNSAAYVPVIFFNKNLSIDSVREFAITSKPLQNAHTFVIQLGKFEDNSLVYVLLKNTTKTYVYTGIFPKPTIGRITVKYDSISNIHSFVLQNGITITSAVVRSENHSFIMNYFSLPYNQSTDSYVSINYLLFRELNESELVPYCNNFSYNGLGIQNYIESVFYNTVRLQFNYSGLGFMCESYDVASYIK